VYNERKIIEQKITSVLKTEYPIDKIEFLIGSDASDDGTDEIINNIAKNNKRIRFFRFEKRSGKIKIINKLVKEAKGDIIISTDAKALFFPDTIFNLVKYHKDDRIAATGGFLINKKIISSGISPQENLFMNREMWIKYRESLLCLHPIGLYGAMYSIKKKFFTDVPENLMVDDFYVNMKVYEKGGKAVFVPDAKAIENLPNEISEEFRRKVRIATGDFQNLKHFFHFLLNPFSCLGFNFLSHKALRWLGPFFMIFAFISLFFLASSLFYRLLLYFALLILIIPVIDFFLSRIDIHVRILRLLTHFLAMNLALFIGFFNALKGVRRSIWEPSKRY
jgi:cellulose synthase/poly-beta-1,6-N-acetylglucosamine synthase-like glycosyltransferase